MRKRLKKKFENNLFKNDKESEEKREDNSEYYLDTVTGEYISSKTTTAVCMIRKITNKTKEIKQIISFEMPNIPAFF